MRGFFFVNYISKFFSKNFHCVIHAFLNTIDNQYFKELLLYFSALAIPANLLTQHPA